MNTAIVSTGALWGFLRWPDLVPQVAEQIGHCSTNCRQRLIPVSMRVWIRLRWQLVLKFPHNLLIDGPLDTSWFMRCEFESMVGGREADPWVFSCVSQFMVQVSLDPSAISSTALPALSQAATKITDVPSSWTNWFVHACSFHHLWSILMIFDDFWSLGSGLVHFGPCPEGPPWPMALHVPASWPRSPDAKMARRCHTWWWPWRRMRWILHNRTRENYIKPTKGRVNGKGSVPLLIQYVIICNYHINRKQFSSTTWVILERTMARRAWQPWFQGATEASVSALESLASCWPTWWLPWGVAARNHIPAVLWCQ